MKLYTIEGFNRTEAAKAYIDAIHARVDGGIALLASAQTQQAKPVAKAPTI